MYKKKLRLMYLSQTVQSVLRIPYPVDARYSFPNRTSKISVLRIPYPIDARYSFPNRYISNNLLSTSKSS